MQRVARAEQAHALVHQHRPRRRERRGRAWAFQHAGGQPDQRRLSRPVRTRHRQPVRPEHAEGELFEDEATVRPVESNLLERQNLTAGGEAGGRQIKGQPAHALDAGLGVGQVAFGLIAQAIGEPGQLTAGIFRLALHGVEENARLAALGAGAAARCVALGLAFARGLDVVTHSAQALLRRPERARRRGLLLGLALGIEVASPRHRRARRDWSIRRCGPSAAAERGRG